jgi:hypothetical protein
MRSWRVRPWRRWANSTGKAREKLLLMILAEDTEKDWSKPSAKKLNPPPVFERFEQDTKCEGIYASCKSLAITADGGAIFACITRKNPKGKVGTNSEFMKEISAFDRRGPHLTQRWKLPEPNGVFPKHIACTRDGSTVVVLESQYVDEVCRCRLMQMAGTTGTVMRREEFTGEPADMAMARDGTGVAVVTHDGKVRVFDATLQPLCEATPESKPKGVLFLRGGELLIATRGGVLLMAPPHTQMTNIISVNAFALSMDDAEELLCVSRWFYVQGVEEDPDEFGVRVFRRGSHELLRELLVPGHHCVQGTISPDGKLVAMEAEKIGAMKKFIVVFEVAIGKEIARRKSPSPYQLCFLPDNRTLAIPFYGYMTAEPIMLWTCCPATEIT